MNPAKTKAKHPNIMAIAIFIPMTKEGSLEAAPKQTEQAHEHSAKVNCTP